MAKAKTESAAAVSNGIIRDIKAGVFAPVYLLMGEEAYYPDLVCDAIVRNALDDTERDFNQRIFYGLDSRASDVMSEASLYPMMAERRLVVLKEAQNMDTLEDLARYCEDPLDSTVLVILMHGASADKRRALYKAVTKKGVVLESPLLRDYEVEPWIRSYYSSRGLSITPDAAALLLEHAGTDLSRIATETDKMLKNLPEGTVSITAAHIEKNIGISREFSIFELTRALSSRNRASALKIAAHLGEQPRFAMPMATAMLFSHFYTILRYAALMAGNPRADQATKMKVLGKPAFLLREYDDALRRYSLRSLSAVTSLLEEYDYKGKGGDGALVPDSELLVELVTKILNS